MRTTLVTLRALLRARCRAKYRQSDTAWRIRTEGERRTLRCSEPRGHAMPHRAFYGWAEQIEWGHDER